MVDGDGDGWGTTMDAARILRVQRSSIYKMYRRGVVPPHLYRVEVVTPRGEGVRLVTRVSVDLEGLRAWFAANPRETWPEKHRFMTREYVEPAVRHQIRGQDLVGRRKGQ